MARPSTAATGFAPGLKGLDDSDDAHEAASGLTATSHYTGFTKSTEDNSCFSEDRLAPDRLVGERGPQEIVKADEGEKDQRAFENVGDRLAKPEQPPYRPAGGGGGPDQLGADQNRDAEQRRRIGPVDRFHGLGQSLVSVSFPGSAADNPCRGAAQVSAQSLFSKKKSG